MTLVKLPAYRLYWGKTQWGAVRKLDLGRWIGLSRYEDIKRWLHFVDDQEYVDVIGEGDRAFIDPIGKLRVVVDMINRKFYLYIAPGLCVNVDESMVGFKGRCFLIRMIKNKPTPVGFRIWCLSDGATGAFLRIMVNDGTECLQSCLRKPCTVTTSQGAHIVLR